MSTRDNVGNAVFRCVENANRIFNLLHERYDMNISPKEFCYWLQGFGELKQAEGKDNEGLTSKQWTVIQDHLALVFDKQTPDRNSEPVAKTEEVDNKPKDINEALLRRMINVVEEDEKKKNYDNPTHQPHFCHSLQPMC